MLAQPKQLVYNTTLTTTQRASTMNEDLDYELNAREDYIRELNNEHWDPLWNWDPQVDDQDIDDATVVFEDIEF